MQKANQKDFRVEQVTMRKLINYMLNGKATIILLTVGLTKEKKKTVKMSEYFAKLRPLGEIKESD